MNAAPIKPATSPKLLADKLERMHRATPHSCPATAADIAMLRSAGKKVK